MINHLLELGCGWGQARVVCSPVVDKPGAIDAVIEIEAAGVMVTLTPDQLDKATCKLLLGIDETPTITSADLVITFPAGTGPTIAAQLRRAARLARMQQRPEDEPHPFLSGE